MPLYRSTPFDITWNNQHEMQQGTVVYIWADNLEEAYHKAVCKDYDRVETVDRPNPLRAFMGLVDSLGFGAMERLPGGLNYT